MSHLEPRQSGVSTREAAAILGTSPSDVLRRIKAGELRAERFERKGGTYFRVYLEPPQEPPGAAPKPNQPPSAAPTAEPLQAAPDATLERLTTALDTVNRLVAQQAGLVSDARRLERENGTLRADRDALAAELARVRRRWWWPW